MSYKKIILTILMLPLILLWAAMLLFSEIFSELEMIAGELLDKVGRAVARVMGIKQL